jgi:hypothetical protein
MVVRSEFNIINHLGGWDASCCVMTICKEVIPSIATTILRVLYCLHVNQYDMFRPSWAIFR